jgi:hypothetical protein
MTSSNKGFELSPEIMKYLGDRGVTAGFDIYYGAREEAKPSDPPNGGPATPVGDSEVKEGPPSVS